MNSRYSRRSTESPVAEDAHEVLPEQRIENGEARRAGDEIAGGAPRGFEQHADTDRRHHIVGGVGDALAHHVQIEVVNVEIAVADQRQDDEQIVPAVEAAGGIPGREGEQDKAGIRMPLRKVVLR